MKEITIFYQVIQMLILETVNVACDLMSWQISADLIWEVNVSCDLTSWQTSADLIWE
jgi:hypothetical protein